MLWARVSLAGFYVIRDIGDSWQTSLVQIGFDVFDVDEIWSFLLWIIPKEILTKFLILANVRIAPGNCGRNQLETWRNKSAEDWHTCVLWCRKTSRAVPINHWHSATEPLAAVLAHKRGWGVRYAHKISRALFVCRYKRSTTMTNQFTDPTIDKSGSTEEILESLTTKELEQYLSFLTWEHSHCETTGPGPYQSANYKRYRISLWIQACREVLASRHLWCRDLLSTGHKHNQNKNDDECSWRKDNEETDNWHPFRKLVVVVCVQSDLLVNLSALLLWKYASGVSCQSFSLTR